jgi:DNA-binding NarL/FixJ family response regulator
MPEMNGIELVKKIREQDWPIKTLILSMHDSEEYVVQSVQAGADGYLLKGASKAEFLKALHKVATGGKYFSGDISSILINNFTNGSASKAQENKLEDPFSLTKREKQILQLVLEGKSSKEIGEALQISKRTAEVHRFNLMKKLDVKNLIELTNKARKHQLA